MPAQIKDLLEPAIQGLLTTGNTPSTPEQVKSYPIAFKGDEERFQKAFDSVFGDFHTLEDPALISMLSACRNFCRCMSFGTYSPYWLSLLGTSGAGKTMLTIRISRFFNKYLEGKLDEQRSNEREQWRRKGGMLEWNRCVSKMVSEQDYGFLRQTEEDWFLAIDDIGAEYDRHKELSVSKLYQIFCQRNNKWMVITANLSAESISQMDARVGSRLFRNGGVVVDVEVPDFNLPTRGGISL